MVVPRVNSHEIWESSTESTSLPTILKPRQRDEQYSKRAHLHIFPSRTFLSPKSTILPVGAYSFVLPCPQLASSSPRFQLPASSVLHSSRHLDLIRLLTNPLPQLQGAEVMADKPARALVIYGDGVMPAVTPHHEHLHRLAASGSSGFLALRTLPSPLDPNERVVIELAQLLDLFEMYTEKQDSAGDADFPSMAERFMGMKSTFVTNSKPALALSKRAGFGAANELTDCDDAAATASNLLGLLGFTESSAKETPNELVFLHMSGSITEAAFLNSLIGCVQEASKEGSLAYGRLFLVVVLGYGDARALEPPPSLKEEISLPPALAALRPRQSYTMKAGKPVQGLREDYPLLAVYNQVAVTRRDEVQEFSFEDFKKRAGNLVMLVDRFLYEVAFKLWKAPKYGA